MTTVEELKTKLRQRGLSDKDMQGMKKGELTETLENLTSLDDVEIESDASSNDEQIPGLRRDVYSEDWTEYILSLLSEKEKRDDHPTVDGLRRVVDQLYGIERMESKVCDSPGSHNNMSATVKVKITTGDFKVTEACADVGTHNTEHVYARHSVATAESRAEGRAYRKILRLTNVITAEENVKEIDIISNPGESITEQQLKVIDNIAGKLNINVKEWLLSQGIQIEKLSQASRVLGQTLCGELNVLQNGEMPMSKSLLGYDKNWRN